MKNLIIGALVGSLILFIWSFLSWTVFNLHASQNQYTPNQTEILECLEGKLSEGQYFVPTVAPGTSQEEHEAMVMESIGKPWAQIIYHEKFEMSMGMNMFRGWLVGFISLLLVCWIFTKIPAVDFKTALLVSLSIGIIGYLTDTYSNSIWFETNTMPDLIDAIVAWGLIGCWLGWWLGRK